jgi:hypothetical protein
MPNAIGGDSFGDRRSDTGQRVDLRGRRDIEIELTADIPCSVERGAPRGVAAARANGRGRILDRGGRRPTGARCSAAWSAPRPPRLGRGVGHLHLVLEGRLRLRGRSAGHCPRDAHSGAKYRDGRDKDEGSMLGLDRHARNLRPAPCTPAPNCCGVYHPVAMASEFAPRGQGHVTNAPRPTPE